MTRIDHEIKVLYARADGKLPTEYEDQFNSNKENLVFAMADGASDAVYSKRWATLLVDNFTSNPFDIRKSQEVLLSWVEPLQLQWRTEINWKDLPWYIEKRAREGAASTLLALQIRASDLGETIDSVAIGDTCLFIIHDDNITSVFPMMNASDFSNNPPLLCSYERENTNISRYIETFSTDINRGDLIILATDAFAKWLLEDTSEGKRSWTLFRDMDIPKFEELIYCLRESKKIINDDTTAAFIYLK